MVRSRDPFPKPRCHKGAAVIDVYDGGKRRMQTLGPWGSEQANLEYERILARLRAGKSTMAPQVGDTARANVPADLTAAEALDRYIEHIQRYYLHPDGTPTGTADDIKITVGYIRRLFAHLLLREFDLRCFKAIRHALIDDGRVRNQVNRRLGMVRSFFRWCLEEELPVTSGVLEKMRAVRPLAPGRDGVPEGKQRAPADPVVVDKVIPLLPRPLGAAMRLIRLTGARPSEILRLKPREIDRRAKVWELTPTRHKGSWRGKARVLYLGPEAQAVTAGTPAIQEKTTHYSTSIAPFRNREHNRQSSRRRL